jgi:hypothetical protein
MQPPFAYVSICSSSRLCRQTLQQAACSMHPCTLCMNRILVATTGTVQSKPRHHLAQRCVSSCNVCVCVHGVVAGAGSQRCFDFSCACCKMHGEGECRLRGPYGSEEHGREMGLRALQQHAVCVADASSAAPPPQCAAECCRYVACIDVPAHDG